jgi:hypothetical protein
VDAHGSLPDGQQPVIRPRQVFCAEGWIVISECLLGLIAI